MEYSKSVEQTGEKTKTNPESYREEKLLLSIEEASRLFGIGQHRLRQIVREDYGYRYHLMLGRVIKIKRKPFEEYLYKTQQI